MSWILWALLLLLQNASFTLVSRARNSKSLSFHAWAAAASNGIWFLSQLIVVDKVVHILQTKNISLAIFTGLFYVLFTMLGSLGMHYLSMNYLERRFEK